MQVEYLTKNKIIMELVAVLLIGGAAGWLGGIIYRGSGLGLVGNIVVGVLGGSLGYWLLGRLGVYLGHGLLGTIFTSAIGAVVILFLVQLIFKRK
jgi:uncharacterized membrane protein YeaQ/YmgE (transglycosylase-associated protein family)